MSETVKVLEIHDDYDLVRIIPRGGADSLYIVSGEEIERDAASVIVRFNLNTDSIMYRGVFLFWDRERHCFVRV